MKKMLHRALIDTLPVMTGYIILGMGFGLLMNTNGFGHIYSILMSVLFMLVHYNTFIPTVIASVIIASSYIWKRNTLLSILSGTVVYMFLIQVIF